MERKVLARRNGGGGTARGRARAAGLAVVLALAASSAATPAPSRPNPYLEPFDPSADYRYELGTAAAAVHTVELDERGFAWPAGLQGDTALLEIEVLGASPPGGAGRRAGVARASEPAVRAQAAELSLRQVFEHGARGRRYLDLSPFLRASVSGPVTFTLDGVRLRDGSAKLYVYRNPLLARTTRVLVVAPHPDDAEIAAFGVYSSTDADVVTVTSGDAGAQGFGVLFPEQGEHFRMKGWIRTWDSITVPFFGGVLPGRARNLGYYDATLGRLWGTRPNAVEPLLATLDHPGHYRSLNVDPVLKERPFTGTWSSLVADLRAELERVNPSVVVAAHPLLDRHRDHRFATFALLQALETWPGECELLLFTNHAVENEAWPLGPRDAMTGLPPWSGGDLYFSRIYSHPLDEAARDKKLIALEAMHDLRPFDLRDGSRPESAEREPIEDRYDYFRRAPRPNELFFVLTKDDASRLRSALLDRSRVWETLRAAASGGSG